MSRRRAVSAFVSVVFLLLIVTTVHSLFSDIDNAEAETDDTSRSTVATYTSSYSESGYRRRHEVVTADDPDAGVDEVFVRALRHCIATDCAAPRGTGDAAVAYALPEPPPKVD